MHRAGPLTHYTVDAKRRTLELVAATGSVPTGMACGLAMLESRVFPGAVVD